MTTGRTVGKYTKFAIEDSGGVLRDIPVSSYGSIGLTYEEVDLSALQDAVKGVLAGQPSMSVTITGPFDNSAAVTASVTAEAALLSGSHTVLSALNGGNVGKSFGIYFGIQGYWANGDPVFGGVDSVIVTDYTVDPAAGTYSAKLTHKAGATAPAWGTAQIAVS